MSRSLSHSVPLLTFFLALSLSLLIATPIAHAKPTGGSFGSRLLSHLPKGFQKRLLLRKLRRDPIVRKTGNDAVRSLVKRSASAKRLGIPTLLLGAGLIATAILAPELFLGSTSFFAASGAGVTVHAALPLWSSRHDRKRANHLRHRLTVTMGQKEATRIGLDSRERGLLDAMATKLNASR